MLDLAPLLIAMASSGAVVALFVLIDRLRLDDYGRRRMWHEATVHLAVGGCLLGIAPPAPFVVGAHVWVTRRGPWPKRFAKAFLATVLCYLTQMSMVLALLSLHPATRPEVVEIMGELVGLFGAHPIIALGTTVGVVLGGWWVWGHPAGSGVGKVAVPSESP